MTKFPFVDSWATVTLPDVVYFQEGPGLRKFQYRESGIPFLNIQTIKDEQVDQGKCKFLDPTEVEAKYRHFLLETDDIICSSSGTIGKTAVIRETDKPLMLNTSIIRFRSHNERIVSRGYLHVFLKSQVFLSQAIGASTGSAQVNFGPTHLTKFSIPVPPLNEQHRIVAKIEELFSEIDKGVESLETAIAQLQVYRQALLKHAFEGKLTAQWRAENPDKVVPAEQLLAQIQQAREERYQQQLDEWKSAIEKWEFGGKEGKKPSKPKKLSEVGTLQDENMKSLPSLPNTWCWSIPEQLCSAKPHSIGIGPFGSNLKVSDYRTAGIPLIFVRNITKLDFSLGLKYVDKQKFEELEAHSVQPLDILITKMGDPPGDCAIYPGNSPVAVLTADCLKFRVWDEFLSREFFAYCIESKLVKTQLGEITKGVAQKKISVARFKSVLFPVAPLEEQKEIALQLDKMTSVVSVLEKEIDNELQKAESLRQSILKQAFSGQLVPQDPTDEPASELLARIKAEKAARETKTKAKTTRKPRKPKAAEKK